MEGQQPGQTISPQTQPEGPRAVQLQPQPSSLPPVAVVQPTPSGSGGSEPPTQWKFQGADSGKVPDPVVPSPVGTTAGSDSISWTASEFIDHNKNIRWYFTLMVAAVILAALVFLATHDKISTGAIVFAALLFGIYAARKPRVLEYRVDDSGLTIGPKLYGYELFKSFSVVDEGAVPSIYLLPLKRFMPALTIYYAHSDEDAIINVLSARLPAEERHVDSVDRLMHRIRF